MKTITVFIITYNQELVIRRALDSILCQKEWGLYQIIIGDDCSKDRTYDILLEYQHQYPDIIRPIRNEKNLGIYGNLQNLIKYREDSDLYINCSGDDAFCEGFFKAIQELINKRNIPLDKEVGIFSDWKGVRPDGKVIFGIQDHSIVERGYNLFSLHMRGIICKRGLMYTKSVIDKYQPVILDKGLHLAEGMFDSQPSRIIKEPFYLPMVTTIYYTGIGISKSLSKTGYATDENIEKWNYYLENLIYEKRDVFYAKYQIAYSEYLIKPSVTKFCNIIVYYLRGLYPVSCKNIMSVFVLCLRLLRYAVCFNKH